MVWVDNRAVFERELAGRLCRRHAEALVVPRGWTVDDRREPRPKLFVTKDHPAPDAGERTKRVSTRRGDTSEVAQVLPFGEPAAATTNELAHELPRESLVDPVADPIHDIDPDFQPDIDPDETRAVPWSPRLVPTEPDDPSGPVFGRLLGRAFGPRNRDVASDE